MADVKNILYVHQSSDMYGSDKVLLNVVRGMKEAGACHPIVVLPSDGPLAECLNGFGIETHIAHVGKVSRRMLSVRGAFSLAWSVPKILADIDRVVGSRPIAAVHSNTLSILGGAVWATFRRTPHIWHVHEIVHHPRIASRIFGFVAHHFSSVVIAVSSAVQAWLISEAPNIERKCVVIHNGYCAPPPPLLARNVRAELGVEEGALVITLMGRIYARKGQLLLVEAVRKLKDSGRLSDSTRILIVGDAAISYEHDLEALHARISAYGLQSFFIFLPYVSSPHEVWRASDIAVVPSLEPESFGLVAIEAMAQGVPVVASAHGGLLDIVEDGRTGLLFPSGNAEKLAICLDALGRSEARRKILGEAASSRQRSIFTLEAQLRLLLRLYDKVYGKQADDAS